MKPPKSASNKVEFEKVSTDDFLNCVIDEVTLDEQHAWSWEGKETVSPAIRFKFTVEGYKFKHYSRWMKYNFGEKSNLFLKFLYPLVEGAKPNMEFDLDRFKGMRVKILWGEKNGFQFPETVRPLGSKISDVPVINVDAEKDEFGADNALPF